MPKNIFSQQKFVSMYPSMSYTARQHVHEDITDTCFIGKKNLLHLGGLKLEYFFFYATIACWRYTAIRLRSVCVKHLWIYPLNEQQRSLPRWTYALIELHISWMQFSEDMFSKNTIHVIKASTVHRKYLHNWCRVH